ncbi:MULTISPECIES: capsule assembly Wzi family protein [Vibrio]|uniref:capsule assembly Wzi family protein n=1 Tax=Vibrio TaxID=662 RepID=UPI001E4C8954|nr:MULTISPECIES: capsule assembly Wzi family protein [Vibrio]
MVNNGWMMKSLVVLLGGCIVCKQAFASPWLETSDPFVRSDLAALSDSGRVNSPTNHFPMLWSMLDSSISQFNVLSSSLNSEYSHLRYRYQAAQLERGNRKFAVIVNSEPLVNNAFGRESNDHWGAYASYEMLKPHYAFRLTTGYSDDGEDRDIRWQDSYLALNTGGWVFSIGTLPRWWGQGWQHNLVLNTHESVPEISLSYTSENNWLGVWSLETLVSDVDDIYQYQWSSRLISKPFSILEYGLTYHQWLKPIDDSDYLDEQVTFDAKLSLPSVCDFYHSVYVEVASDLRASQLGALLFGWSGFIPFDKYSFRLVIERQQGRDDDLHVLTDMKLFNDKFMRNSYLVEDGWSVSGYVQLANDHQIEATYQEQTQYQQQGKELYQVSYRLPALSGRLTFGVDREQSESSQTNYWSNYEFRF